jgi:hypothetical protein
MGSTGLGAGIMEIASALLAIALIALLLNKSTQAGQLVSQTGTAFDELLRTVTMQNGSSLSF